MITSQEKEERAARQQKSEVHRSCKIQSKQAQKQPAIVSFKASCTRCNTSCLASSSTLFSFPSHRFVVWFTWRFVFAGAFVSRPGLCASKKRSYRVFLNGYRSSQLGRVQIPAHTLRPITKTDRCYADVSVRVLKTLTAP